MASVGHAVILTQLPVRSTGASEQVAGGLGRTIDAQGARLILLDTEGRQTVLTETFYSACDPDISFDGSRVLFAGRRAATDKWNIYEMAIDGSDVRQITRDLGDCGSPCYQSSLYTLKPVGVPSVPEYHLTFVAGTGTMNEWGDSEATSLYSCKFDGTAVRQLTFNLSSDLDPCILPDGRLVFASWQRSRLDNGPGGRIGLFGLNIDGSDYATLTADQGKRIQRMPCVMAQGWVVFVEADTVAWDGAGSLASVTLRRPLHSYRVLTTGDQGLFHSPSPLTDGRLLVSRRPGQGDETYGVCVFDPARGQVSPVFDDPQWHDIQAKAVCPRSEPDGRSTAVPEEPDVSAQTGKFYCLNVNISDLEPSWLPSGSVKRLRVLEGIAAQRGSQDGRVGIPRLAQRRILGDVPVEQDGSFNIEIPANTAIELQTLDADGMALRSCGWIWAKDRARQGCIGCHEDPELTPENVFVDAVKRPSVKLTLPADKRRTVDFQRDVMPVIADKCARCHSGADAPVRLPADPTPVAHDGGRALFSQSYESLLGSDRASGRGKYVHPGAARTSPLIWRLYGRNTSRPWDPPVQPGRIRKMPPEGAAALSDDEKRTFVEWIDMGALWNGVPGPEANAPEP